MSLRRSLRRSTSVTTTSSAASGMAASFQIRQSQRASMLCLAGERVWRGRLWGFVPSSPQDPRLPPSSSPPRLPPHQDTASSVTHGATWQHRLPFCSPLGPDGRARKDGCGDPLAHHRVSGTLFLSQPFTVSTNKMTFMEDLTVCRGLRHSGMSSSPPFSMLSSEIFSSISCDLGASPHGHGLTLLRDHHCSSRP